MRRSIFVSDCWTVSLQRQAVDAGVCYQRDESFPEAVLHSTSHHQRTVQRSHALLCYSGMFSSFADCLRPELANHTLFVACCHTVLSDTLCHVWHDSTCCYHCCCCVFTQLLVKGLLNSIMPHYGIMRLVALSVSFFLFFSVFCSIVYFCEVEYLLLCYWL